MTKTQFIKICKMHGMETKDVAAYLRKARSTIRAYKSGRLKVPFLVAEKMAHLYKTKA